MFTKQNFLNTSVKNFLNVVAYIDPYKFIHFLFLVSFG